MRAATTRSSLAVKRQHESKLVVSVLLSAKLSKKPARSIKYQSAISRLLMAKEIDEFVFGGTPINETLVRHLDGGAFLAQQHNSKLPPIWELEGAGCTGAEIGVDGIGASCQVDAEAAAGNPSKREFEP